MGLLQLCQRLVNGLQAKISVDITILLIFLLVFLGPSEVRLFRKIEL